MSQYQYNQQTPAYGQQNRYQGQGYQGMDYNVDMVFCIDATGSMEDYGGGQKRLINMVKEGALNFYYDFGKVMQSKNKHVNQLRIRVIAFRDYLADGDEAMLVTDFFNLPQQAEDFQNCINSIDAMGGGDIPEDGLEALAYAIRSDWNPGGGKKRQVIVLWTDADPHPLQYGASAPNYPRGMPRDLGELSEWWDTYMDPQARRLVLFAPEEQGWEYISANWANVVHFPSEAGNGLAEKTYAAILDCMANTI